MFFAFALGIDKDVIKVHYYENVKLLCQDLVYIVLKRGQCVGQFKRYHLILKMAITGLKNCFPFVSFPNPHSMVNIN